MDPFETHGVTNQPPPLQDYNLYDTDTALKEALHREGGGWAESRVRAYGEVMGSEQAIRWGHEANTYTPELRSHDRFGHRIDEVDRALDDLKEMELSVDRAFASPKPAVFAEGRRARCRPILRCWRRGPRQSG